MHKNKYRVSVPRF